MNTKTKNPQTSAGRAKNDLLSRGEIIGVAVKHGDLVIGLPKPKRHHHVLNHMVNVLGIKPPVGHQQEYGQGFYLADGTYLNRLQAHAYAHDIGQITVTDHPELFSEDLW